MALSKEDLLAIDTLIQSRHPVPKDPPHTQIVKPDLNLGDVLTKVATAGLVAGMGWLITSVSTMKTQQALIVQEQTNQKEALVKLSDTVSDGTRDRYTRQDAITDNAELIERIATFTSKQKEGFSRIEKLEQDVAILKATLE